MKITPHGQTGHNPQPIPGATSAQPDAGPLPTDEFVARVRIFPQDPLVGQTEEVELPREVMGERLSSERIRTRDRSPVAIADPEGNYTHVQEGTPQFDQVNAHAVVARTLHMYDGYLGRPATWAFDGPLTVKPHAGTGKTAFYRRWDGSINFFEWNSESLGKRVTTAQSADVIAHEIGHAIWDGVRPRAGYANEAGAFHEAFGDCSALLHALQQPSNLVKALEQNGGDLNRPSLLSNMAEEFGSAFNKEDQDPNNDNRTYYRTALNSFKYIDPSLLPDDDYPPTVPEEVLTREFHSFSRVWTGTFYNMLTALYEREQSSGKTNLEALTSARDTLGHTFGKSLDELPPTGIRYRHVAESMLTQTLRNNRPDDFITLARVLLERDVLTQEQVDAIRNRQLPKLEKGSNESVLLQVEKTLGLEAGYAAEGEPQVLPDGRTIYLFTRPERHALPGLQHDGDGVELELRSGVMVAFDQDGGLLNLVHTPVDDQTRREAEVMVADLDKKGRLNSGDIFKNADEKGRPYLMRSLPDRPGVRLLERVPVFD